MLNNYITMNNTELSSVDKGVIRQIVLETMETMLELQLRAVRQIQGTEELPPPVRLKRGLRKTSLVSLSIQLITDEGRPLHVDEIVELILQRFGRVTDKDAIAGGLSKKAGAEDVIKRCAKNTYGLIERD